MSSGAAGGRRTYQTLDGLRGLAAIIVVTRHAPPFFPSAPFPESWLAVDLFFMLSGFVIAHAYEAKLRAGGFLWSFAKIRMIRLYPLYLLGAGLAFLDVYARRHALHFNREELIQLIVAMMFMLPSFPGFMGVVVLNGPTWTLLPELIANFVYAGIVRWLNVVLLLLLMGIGAAGMVASVLWDKTFGLGWLFEDLWVALARVMFSFFAGVLLYRLHKPTPWTSPLAAGVVMAISVGCLLYAPPEDWRGAYELAMALVVFPLLVTVACHVEPGRRRGRVAGVLGVTSYAIYVLHAPLGRFAAEAFEHLSDVDLSSLSPTAGGLFLVGVVLTAWIADKVYDTPVRRLLTERFVRRRAMPAPLPKP